MPVYIDILILVNFVIDLFLLKCASFLSSESFVLSRAAIASVIGSLGALTIFLPPFSFVTMVSYKLLFGAVMTFLSFGYKSGMRFLRSFFSLLLCTFLFSGVVSFIYITLRPSKMTLFNGSLYLDVSMAFLIFSALIFYILVTLLNYIFKSRHSEEVICRLKIVSGENEADLRGLIDTGSSLREPFSNFPVIVTEERYFPHETEDKNALSNSLRLVPFSSIAGEGILKAFLADEVSISLKGSTRTIEKGIYIALTKEKIGKNFYNAIVNPEVLEK